MPSNNFFVKLKKLITGYTTFEKLEAELHKNPEKQCLPDIKALLRTLCLKKEPILPILLSKHPILIQALESITQEKPFEQKFLCYYNEYYYESANKYSGEVHYLVQNVFWYYKDNKPIYAWRVTYTAGGFLLFNSDTLILEHYGISFQHKGRFEMEQPNDFGSIFNDILKREGLILTNIPLIEYAQLQLKNYRDMQPVSAIEVTNKEDNEPLVNQKISQLEMEVIPKIYPKP